MELLTLRLVCQGARAKAISSLPQKSNSSLIQELTETATLYSKGFRCLADGQDQAVYEGRGDHRDVYRVNESWVLKLCTEDGEQLHQSNQLEVAALET